MEIVVGNKISGFQNVIARRFIFLTLYSLARHICDALPKF